MGSPAAHTEPAARDVLAWAGISKRNKQLQVNSDPLSFTMLTVFPLGDWDVKLIAHIAHVRLNTG